jgi:hydrogenase nickel incorporation protein HypB
MHGCTAQLEQDLLAKNQLIAERNRGWFEGREILAVNLMSSPGAVKTTLLEKTIVAVGRSTSVYVVEGDQ